MPKDVTLNLKINPCGTAWMGRQAMGLSTSTKSCGNDFVRGPAKKQAPKKRSPRGSQGISAHGRSRVRNGAHILEEDHGRHNIAFLTLTLPFIEDSHLIQAYNLWSRAVGAFEDRIRRKLPKHLQRWVHCTEDQKRGAPHLHMAYPGRTHRQGRWLLSKDWFRCVWRDIWIGLMPKESEGLNWDYSTRIEAVRKSVSGYLGKYISKGGRPVNPHRYPSSWWGTTDGIKREISRRTIKVLIKVSYVDWGEVLGVLVNTTDIYYSKFFELQSGMTWGLIFKVNPACSWKIAHKFLCKYEGSLNRLGFQVD